MDHLNRNHKNGSANRMLFGVIGLFLLLGPANPLFASNQPLRVHLDWIPDAEFAGIFMAMEKGWYKEAGIDIELVPAGLDTMPSLPKGQPDVGIHSGQDIIRAAAGGAPIRAFAANYQASPICIVVGQDSGINNVRDLKGKTVGIFAPQDYDTFRIILANNGLSLSDIKTKKINTINEVDLVKMLRNREIDALPAWEFNWTLTFPLLGYKVRVFPGYDNGFHFYGIVYFANREALKNKRDLLVSFLRVTIRGWREVFKDVNRAAQLIVDKYYPTERLVAGSKALTQKQQMMELKLAQRFFFEGVGKAHLGRMSHWKWQRSIDIAKKFGVIPTGSRLQVKDVFDGSIIESAQKGAP